MGRWWAGNVSLFLSILVAGLIRTALSEFGLEEIVELLVRAGEGMTASGHVEAQEVMIALLSANVLYFTLVALLVLRLLNGCLRCAALQYPNSETIQRLNVWVNVRGP